MTETFSPYRDWLGLAGVTSRPDHYQLLGLAPLEADPALIRAAADRSLNRLRGTVPDGHDREWMQLMRELLEAEEALTEPSKKAEYDQRLRGSGNGAPQQPQYPQYPAAGFPQQAYPPANPWQGAPNPMAPMAPNPMAPVGGYGAPMPPQYPQPAAPWAGGYPPNAYPQPGYQQAGYPPPAYPNYYPQQSAYVPPPPPPPASNVPDPMAPLTYDAPPVDSPFGLPAAPEFAPRIGPATFAATAWPAAETPTAVAAPEPPPELPADRRWKRNEEEAPAETTAAPGPTVSKPKPLSLDADNEADHFERNLQKMLIPLGGVAAAALLVLIVVNSFGSRPNREIAKNPPVQPTTPVVNPPPKPPETTPVVAPPKVDPPKEEEPESPPPKPDRRRPKPKLEPEEMPAEEEMPAKPTPEPKPEPIKPTPEPTPEPPKPEPTTPAPKAEDVIKLAKALQEARLLVRESNAEGAMQKLKEVESLPMTPAHRAKWDRLYFLSDSVAQCVAAIRRTVPRLEAASTITVGTTVISIVEGDENKIVVRINGQNRTFNLNELPVGLGIALADMSLDRKEAVNLVVKGAYVVARSSDDAQLAKARGWWQEAISRGVSECERLVPVIEDTYDLEKEVPRD